MWTHDEEALGETICRRRFGYGFQHASTSETVNCLFDAAEQLKERHPIDIAKDRRMADGEAQVRAALGRPTAELTKRVLQEALAGQSYAPPRLWRQDKADLVAHVQEYAASERHGESLITRLGRAANGERGF